MGQGAALASSSAPFYQIPALEAVSRQRFLRGEGGPSHPRGAVAVAVVVVVAVAVPLQPPLVHIPPSPHALQVRFLLVFWVLSARVGGARFTDQSPERGVAPAPGSCAGLWCELGSTTSVGEKGMAEQAAVSPLPSTGTLQGACPHFHPGSAPQSVSPRLELHSHAPRGV